MSIFLRLVWALKCTDQKRGEQTDALCQDPEWSPHVEKVRCSNIASTAELSPEDKQFGVWNPICSHELFR